MLLTMKAWGRRSQRYAVFTAPPEHTTSPQARRATLPPTKIAKTKAMAIHTAKIVDMVLREAQRGSQGTASELPVRTHTRKCQSRQERSQQTEFWLGYQRQQPVRQNQVRRAVGYVFADRKGSGKKKKENHMISLIFLGPIFFFSSHFHIFHFFFHDPLRFIFHIFCSHVLE